MEGYEYRLPRLVGSDVSVPTVGGSYQRYVNLDYAATTPALESVRHAVEEFLPFYSSAHRGAGFKSHLATAALEGARAAVAEFVGCSDDGNVIFVRNTTEAINLLSAALPAEMNVVTTSAEHHANLLPWQRRRANVLSFPRSPEDLVASCEHVLTEARGTIGLVAVTGASNVTGEITPFTELAEVAHRHGAALFVDAAQLVAHRPIDMEGMGIDCLAFSGHKLYAPYGVGVLVVRSRGLLAGEPLLRGGGAVRSVGIDGFEWAEAPACFEAGSPNIIGTVALGAACDALAKLGLDAIAAQERVLTEQMLDGLAGVRGLVPLSMWPQGSCETVGIAAFTLGSVPGSLVAAVLACENAIGVRTGRFCAHPLVEHLLDRDRDVLIEATEWASGMPLAPGESRKDATRASLGLMTTEEDIDLFIEALTSLAERGPGWNYRVDGLTGDIIPEPDTRPWPNLPIRIGRHGDRRCVSREGQRGGYPAPPARRTA